MDFSGLLDLDLEPRLDDGVRLLDLDLERLRDRDEALDLVLFRGVRERERDGVRERE